MRRRCLIIIHDTMWPFAMNGAQRVVFTPSRFFFFKTVVWTDFLRWAVSWHFNVHSHASTLTYAYICKQREMTVWLVTLSQCWYHAQFISQYKCLNKQLICSLLLHWAYACSTRSKPKKHCIYTQCGPKRVKLHPSIISNATGLTSCLSPWWRLCRSEIR